MARWLAPVFVAVCLCVSAPSGQTDPAEAFVGQWIGTGPSVVGVSVFRSGGNLRLQIISDCDRPPCASPPTPLFTFTSETQQRGLAVWSDGLEATHAAVNVAAGRLFVEIFDIKSNKRARVKARATLARANDLVNAAYRAEFGRSFGTPAVHIDQRAVQCRVEAGATSTAYRRVSDDWSDLLVLRLNLAGELVRKSNPRVLTPAGRFRVITFVMDYPTLGPDFDRWWPAAQARINGDHLAFAKSRGYPAPLVQFDNINFRVPISIDSNRLEDQKRAAEQAGIRVGDYQVFVTLDLNPGKVSGGQANLLTRRSVYFGVRAATPLTEKQWHSVAASIYHHEIAHLWGWEHDWAQDCTRTQYVPFITNPVLFGWEDLDGDGIPEISDTSPYGVSSQH